MTYRIRIDEPGDQPRVVDVEGRLEVGRQVDGVRLFDPTVSRRHIILEARPDGLVAVDLGSSYGSFVHGYRLAGPVTLAAGDVVHLGNSAITVIGPVPAPEPVPAPAPADLQMDQTLTPPPPVSATDAIPVAPQQEVGISATGALVLLDGLTVLSLALPIGVLVTVRDLFADLGETELALRMVLLASTLLVSTAGLLGISAVRAAGERALLLTGLPALQAQRRSAAVGVLPAWLVCLGVLGLITDLAVGALVVATMAVVLAVWLWASRRPRQHPTPTADRAGVPSPDARTIAVVAFMLAGILSIVCIGLALRQVLAGEMDQSAGVLLLILAMQGPLPLLGLLRP